MTAVSQTMKTYTMYAGLWRTDSSFVSTIRVKNVLVVAPLDVYTSPGGQLLQPGYKNISVCVEHKLRREDLPFAPPLGWVLSLYGSEFPFQTPIANRRTRP
jgi:hypothetical protein